MPAPALPFGKKAILTVISDDADFETGRLLDLLASSLEIKITIAAPVANVAPRLEWWQEAEARGWLEIVNHSWSHLGMDENTPLELIRHEYICAKKFFERNFNTPQFAFVPAFNYIPPAGYDVLEAENIIAARGYVPGINSLRPQSGRAPGYWHNLKTRGIGDVGSTRERNQWLIEAVQKGGWLIEMWHNVHTGNAYGYQPLSMAEAAAHLGFAKSMAELWIAPFSEAVAFLREADFSHI